MNTQAIIAQQLNILESDIKKVEEWANVIFVVIKKIGARFVSKKIIQEEEKVELHFTPHTQYDAVKAVELLVNFYYEWNAELGCFIFEEKEELIDNLESEIVNLFNGQVNGYFEIE